MFQRILIANRGEIACRVTRTARRLGVTVIAVYSEADAGARHVREADEAYLIGPAPAPESYLRAEAIIEAARRSGAEAVHPGYGFLAENAAFAESCAEAGIVFIGPPPDAIRAMGSKSAAKALMERAGVPVVPGYHGDDQADPLLRAQADGIGYPVLIKAAAGGGGKGMRRVDAAEDFAAALGAARREARAAFGDDQVLIEKYLTRPRHIEIQVFADDHGDAVHLFERDCSLQRRHQKVVEEAPAPGMSAAMRERMGAAAVAAARAIGYRGAGTVEFIVDASEGLEDGHFYFMEMNTRLQVEHPVTEMITGQDLVEWQLRVAAGEPLPRTQEALAIDGHAIEVRLYAEDPRRSFLPQTGTIERLVFPAPTSRLRIDSGIAAGDQVSVHYDPMIAKLIVWDRDRPSALRALAAALRNSQIVDLATNLDFLGAVARHPAFAAGEVDTGFIERHAGDLIPERGRAPTRVLMLAAMGVLLHRAEEAGVTTAATADPYSPWALVNGWRLNDDGHDVVHLFHGDEEVPVTINFRDRDYLLEVGDERVAATGELAPDGSLQVDFGGVRLRAVVVFTGREVTVFHEGECHRFLLHEVFDDIEGAEAAGATVAAPMPGKVIQLIVGEGAQVKRGEPLLILEAMKMEHTIVAPTDGTVVAVNVEAGQQVDEGLELVDFQPLKAG